MANITAKDVATLRAKTGIGMMECKKALVEADGDVEEAIKILRKRGELKAEAKAATRIAADGIVDILKDGDTTSDYKRPLKAGLDYYKVKGTIAAY